MKESELERKGEPMDLTDREKALAYFRNREAQTPMPGARAMYQEAIKALEQPEVIRCKDCKWGTQDEVGRWFCRGLGCQIGNEDGSGFCADAERRTE